MQVLYKHVMGVGGWGVRPEMLILLMWLGGVGGRRQNVKDLNLSSPEKGL